MDLLVGCMVWGYVEVRGMCIWVLTAAISQVQGAEEELVL